MSKMNELSLAKATELESELDNFRRAALPNLRGYLLGTLLRFKQGDWIHGDKKLEKGTRLIALMNHASHGWLKWNPNKTATHVVGRIADDFEPPKRSELDCSDETAWPIGLSGKKEDPWKEVLYLPFLSLDGETLLTFATTTKTGRPAAWKFVDRYAWLGRKHPGQYPIVELQVDGFDNNFGGWTETPQFEIVDWTDRPDLTLLIGSAADDSAEPGDEPSAEPSRKDDLGEEIPF